MIKRMRMNKKGQVINTAIGVLVGLLVALLIAFAVMLGISSLNPGSFFTSGSLEQNTTNQAVSNYTTGIGLFFAQIPTSMKILGVVLVLGFLALLVTIVLRFRDQAGSGAGAGSL